MEIGNLVKYENCGDVHFGVVFNIDTDDNNEVMYWVLWDDHESSREYPGDEHIQVIQ